MASSKDLKPLQKIAKKQGWDVIVTKNGRIKWTSPQGGVPYFSSSTPSDSRAIRNISADLAKKGLVL